MATDESDFTDFVSAHEPALRRLCWALTGNQHTGEDLAQATLERLWRYWPRVAHSEDTWSYTQRIATSLYSTWWRRKWRQLETPTPDLPDLDRRPDVADLVVDTDLVARWLDKLPRRQRAVIILRFLCDLSIGETARVLGCSAGTVKSQATRALRSLSSTDSPAQRILEEEPL